MADSDRGAGGHGWLHMIIGCGLLLVGLLVLSQLGAGWGAALIVLALIVCPLAMIGLLRSAESDRSWIAWGRKRHEKNP